MRTRLCVQRMIFLLSILMILGFGKAIMVEAVVTPKEETKLTEKFLTGTWVCPEGFVCSYKSGLFVDSSGLSFHDCKVNNGAVTGTSLLGKTASTNITIIDKNTIQVGEDTAVRAESKLGKEYQAQFANLLIGKWINYDGDRGSYYEFKKDNSLILSWDLESKYSYDLIDGGIKIYNNLENTMREEETLFLRIREDNTLSFCIFSGVLKLYREGSDISTEMQSGKAELIGDWIFVSMDEKTISQWKFDTSDILTIDYFNKEKDNQQTFSTSRENFNLVVTMGGKKYNLKKTYASDGLNAFRVNGDIEGILYRKDCEDGKDYIKKAEEINKVGKFIQRTHYQKFNDILYPEITAISVSLECMSNLWLKDEVKIEENSYSDSPFLGVCGLSYIIDSKIRLKNAKIVFTYDESELPYAYENDLVIVHMDSKTGEKNILKTTRNLKSNKVAAKITEGGVYYLADSVIVNGGTRDITSRNPKTTEWARSKDTGDILSLIDLKYIKKSNGNFKVSTVSQLASVVYYVNTTPDACTYVTLEKDIDLSGYEWAPMGWSSSPENSFGFEGIIYGNNHTIRNLYIDTKGNDVGLLGWAPCVSVYNLNITKAIVSGGGDVGILTGQSIGSYYQNCHVDGVVNGYEAGSLVGYDANNEFIKCSADVIVNGSKFNFLSWNKKEISEIVIEDYITITMDESYTMTRPEVTGYNNLTWSVDYNGRNVLGADAKNHTTFQYYLSEPGNYTVYLIAHVQGQYVRVSNEIKYRIE